MQTSDLAKRMPFAGVVPAGFVGNALRRWFGGPRGFVLLAVALITAGLATGWSWLTAIGLAPLILSVAPCAAMCALGACAMCRGGSSPSTSASAPPHVGGSGSADGHAKDV